MKEEHFFDGMSDQVTKWVPKVEGDLVQRPDLAKTLEQVSEKGASAFYEVHAFRSLQALPNRRRVRLQRPLWRRIMQQVANLQKMTWLNIRLLSGLRWWRTSRDSK